MSMSVLRLFMIVRTIASIGMVVMTVLVRLDSCWDRTNERALMLTNVWVSPAAVMAVEILWALSNVSAQQE